MKTSVIIPCYNAEQYVGQAIGSVLSQSLPPSEIIVVDDGSTDDSATVVRRFGSHVRLVEQSNAGASVARNRGATLASGEALMFLDADDVLGPAALEALVAALRRDPRGIAVAPWYCLTRSGDQWVTSRRNTPPRRVSQDDLSAWIRGWFHTPCSVLWSRDAFEQAGPWDQSAYVMDDGEIMMRAMARGSSLVRASFGAAYYRRDNDEDGSVSDARLKEAGLRSRIYSFEKVAGVLREEGRLEDYEPALSDAFDRIAEDCAGAPSLRARCRELAQAYGGPPAYRRARRRIWDLLSKVDRTARRSIPLLALNQVTSEPAEVITYGQEWNEPERRPQRGDDVQKVPAVSVIVPTYNRADLLRRAVGSVLAQTFGDLEVLVVDDASSDETPDVVAALDDPRVRYLRQDTNRGVSAARNRGLREARGTYIAFLDSDDQWLPEKLDVQVGRLQEAPDEVGLLYAGVERVGDRGVERVEHPAHRGAVHEHMLVENVISATSGVVIRRGAADRTGFFDEQAPANEDWDYWTRLSECFAVDFVDDVLVRYSAATGHLRKTMALKDDSDARARFYKKNGDAMKRSNVAHTFLLESARRCLVPGHWEPHRARQVLAEVVRTRPFTLGVLTLYLRSLLPHGIYLAARQALRRGLQRYAEWRRGGRCSLSKGVAAEH